MGSTDLISLIGRSLLFIGTETDHWSQADMVNAAKTALSLGFEAIVPKKFDGTNRWYGDIASLQAEREAVEATGCKYLPFGYLYGPAFGNDQIVAECQRLSELQSACHGVAVADMESEWNGQVNGAQLFATTMSKMPPGTLLISTWADPLEQNWQDVISALHSQVDGWWPQEYDNWLAAAATREFAYLKETCIQPTIHVTNDIGPNDPLAIIKQKLSIAKGPISVWEYQTAVANPALAKSITALIASLEGDPVKTISLSDPEVAKYYKQASGNAWECTVQGYQNVIGNAMLKFYQEYGGNDLSGYCGLTYLGLPITNEIPVPGIAGATAQRYERAVLVYDPSHKNDSPPGAGSVYLAHLYQGLGVDPRLQDALQQIATLQQQLADCQKNNSSLTAIQQIKTIVAPF
jgi:hypothetical protein